MKILIAIVFVLCFGQTTAEAGRSKPAPSTKLIYKGKVLKVEQWVEGRKEGLQPVLLTISQGKKKSIKMIAGKMIENKDGKMIFDPAFQKRVLALKKGQYVKVFREDEDCDCICFEKFEVIKKTKKKKK